MVCSQLLQVLKPCLNVSACQARVALGYCDFSHVQMGKEVPPDALAAINAASPAPAAPVPAAAEAGETPVPAAAAVDAPAAPLMWQQLVRRQWLLGSIAELRREPAAAAVAFAACHRLLLRAAPTELSAGAADGAADQQPAPMDISSEAGPSGSEAQAAPAAAAAAGAAPVVRLRGSIHNAVISAAAVDAKLQVSVGTNSASI